MRYHEPPGRAAVARRTPAMEAALELAEAWQEGSDEVEAVWSERQGSTPSVVAAMVKAELRCRYERGESPEVAEYLDRHPELESSSPLVVSLVYEEYCLREEVGQGPTPSEFCARYARWDDSLASQLRYHRMLSRAAGRSEPTPRFPEPGETFLRLRLGHELGRGGEARVYVAEDLDLGGCVRALKISPDRGDEPAMMGRLNHPRIVPVLWVARDELTGLRGLCMPFRAGRALHEVLIRMDSVDPAERTARTLWSAIAEDEDGLIKPPGLAWEGFPLGGSYADAVAWVGAALSDALTHAHELGIQHRDIKPANVLMTLDGGPQLLDFNLAHDPHEPRQAAAARRGGTLPYMAPEQISAFLDARRWDEVGRTADVYALGLVLRELLTGRRPEAPSADLPLPRALQDQLDRRREILVGPRALNPMVPAPVELIVRRCLSPVPADRYATASALAKDLRRHLRGYLPAEAPEATTADRARAFVGRNRAGLIAAGVAVIFGLAALPLSRESEFTRVTHEARESLLAHDFARATERLSRLHELRPDDLVVRETLTDASVGAAKQALGNERTASAREAPARGIKYLKYLDKARDLGYQPDVDDAPFMARAASYLATGGEPEAARARELVEVAFRLDPSGWRVHQALGQLASQRHAYREAADHYQRSFEAALAQRPADRELVLVTLLNFGAGAAIQSKNLTEAERRLDLIAEHEGSNHAWEREKLWRAARARTYALRACLKLHERNQLREVGDFEASTTAGELYSAYLEEARTLNPRDGLIDEIDR